jgi:hypothetical protein
MEARYDQFTDTLTFQLVNGEPTTRWEGRPGVLLGFDRDDRLLLIELTHASQRVDDPQTVTMLVVKGTDRAAVARSLLELEREYDQKGVLDASQNEVWQKCVLELFGHHDSHQQRRSFRLRAGMRARTSIGSGSFECTILELSRLGFTLTGPVFSHVTAEDVTIVEVEVDGQFRSLDLPCRIVRRSTPPSGPVAGIEIARESSADSKQRYFDLVYYPCYIHYLEDLAGEPPRMP